MLIVAAGQEEGEMFRFHHTSAQRLVGPEIETSSFSKTPMNNNKVPRGGSEQDETELFVPTAVHQTFTKKKMSGETV